VTEQLSPSLTNMERSIAALALELPAKVWEDVRNNWRAARDSLRTEVERLQLGRDAITDGLADWGIDVTWDEEGLPGLDRTRGVGRDDWQ